MITITPETYHTNPEHKAIADQVAEAAGIPSREIILMTGEGDIWTIERLEYDANGRPFMRDGDVATSTTTVTWP